MRKGRRVKHTAQQCNMYTYEQNTANVGAAAHKKELKSDQMS